MIIPTQTRPFALGDAVHLRGSAFGVPGRIVRLGKRLSVFWPDLDYIGRHSPESLMLAGEHSILNPTGGCKPLSCNGLNDPVLRMSVSKGAGSHAE